MATTEQAAPSKAILTTEQRRAICDAFRDVLAAPRTSERLTEHVNLGQYGELDIQRPHDPEIHLHLNTSHVDGPSLTTGEVTDCPQHQDGWDRSTLADLGPEYAALKRELLAVACEMCNLPRDGEGLIDRVMGPIEFQNTTCHAGVCTFTFVCFVAYPVLRVYQYRDVALADQLGIPIDPSIDEPRTRGIDFRTASRDE